MSYYEGLSCPVCVKPFTSDEDIVVCPQCGLPHHRACWKTVGKCYEHDKHGTAQQWSRDNAPSHATPASEANVCPQCMTSNAQYAEFCSRCGHSLSTDDWHSAYAQQPSSEREYAPYHATVGANNYSSSECIDGVAVDDLAATVGSNLSYYMPRFRRMAHGESGGWNWAAFLFSPYWLFYRKQYLLGAIYLAVFMLNNILSAIISLSLPAEADPAALQIAAQEIQNHFLFYPYMALMYIWLAMIILLAIKGNAFYLSHCKKKVGLAHQKTPDITASELGVSGGVSFGMTFLVLVVTRIGVITIASLLQNWIK